MLLRLFWASPPSYFTSPLHWQQLTSRAPWLFCLWPFGFWQSSEKCPNSHCCFRGKDNLDKPVSGVGAWHYSVDFWIIHQFTNRCMLSSQDDNFIFNIYFLFVFKSLFSCTGFPKLRCPVTFVAAWTMQKVNQVIVLVIDEDDLCAESCSSSYWLESGKDFLGWWLGWCPATVKSGLHCTNMDGSQW